MSDDALGLIIGNSLRAKLLRLFITNKDEIFDPKDLKSSLSIQQTVLSKELRQLEKEGIIKKKKSLKIVVDKKDKKKKKEFTGFLFDRKFLYRATLENLILQTIPISTKSFIKAISTLGPLDAFITGGIFSRTASSQLDILIAGNDINEDKLKKIVRELEKMVGRKLRYMSLDTNEFVYRYNINDEVIRSLLDHSPQVHIDNIGVR